MNRLFFIYFIVIGLAMIGCNGTPSEVTPEMIHFPKAGDAEDSGPRLEFEATEFDFGTISEGEQITRFYRFTNTGKMPLVISQVTANCGCTVPKTWPREPIGPGKSGQIEITFDSDQREGIQTKMISVVANTRPATHTLILKGIVKGPETK